MPSQYIVSELVARQALDAIAMRLRWYFSRGCTINRVPSELMLAFRQLAEKLGHDPIEMLRGMQHR